MLQYLINTTAIWLMSLIIFDVFLRRESYHGYNRFYLLFTFLIGIFIPLWQWQDAGHVYSQTLQEPLRQVMATKQNIVAPSTPVTSVDWAQWAMVAYLSGASVALCLLMVEVIKLVTFYKKGTKSLQHGWAIVETGKEHAPFSFLNTLFVCSRQQYSDEEWNMVLTHEGQHSARLHLADLALMQACRIVFWFHPLVYIYNRRLLLVHEYQADHVAGSQPQAYGAFLVEQALLQAAPSISNSFNRSPIKKRIVMLTKKTSPRAANLKLLLVLPLTMFSLLFFTKNGYSTDRIKNGNKVTFRGNVFTFSESSDTVHVTVKAPGATQQPMMLRRQPAPEMINKEKIYEGKAVTGQPSFPGGLDKQYSYLADGLKDELLKLPDNDYYLLVHNIVLDKKGKIAYYDIKGLMYYTADANAMFGQKQTILSSPEVVKAIERMLDNMPNFNPATFEGAPVASNWGSTLILPAGKGISVHNGVVKINDAQK